MERFTRQPGSNASPTPAAQSAQTTPHSSAPKSKDLGTPTMSSKLLVVAVIVVSLALIVALAFGMFKFGTKSLVDTSKYQAVFLQNGQVYFGHVSNINSEYVQLEDIYYLQVQQQVQPDQQTADGQQAQTPQQQISLAKLGSELHGPEDLMFISRDQIVFWENLKDDGSSQVVEAIKTDKQGSTDSTQTDTTSPTDTTTTPTTP